jgi:hypothetical protein
MSVGPFQDRAGQQREIWHEVGLRTQAAPQAASGGAIAELACEL